MQRRSERGEGRLSTFIWLLVFVGVVYAGWHIAPVYYAHYNFKDNLVEVARLPRGSNSDEKVLEACMKRVQENDLTPYFARSSFRIQTSEASRRIAFAYEREAEVLPGWKHVFRFEETVDQPLLW
jgi:hypothetical protein